MADQNTAPTAEPIGQAGAAPAAAGTTAPAPVATSGQGTVAAPTGTGQAATDAPAAEEPTFFDPKTLDPALQPAYQQMRGAFTKKMQELGTFKEKVAAYDAFMADPVTNLQNLAGQYGFRLTRAEAQAALQQQGGAPSEWDPRSGADPPNWETVLSIAEKRAEERLLQKLGPVVQNVQNLQKQSVEAQLDSIDPEWRQYEPAMRTLLKENPALGNNIKRLYNLALLEEGVYESRALQAAQRRMQDSASAARVAGKSTTTSQPAPIQVKSFDDAVKEAKRQLASGGNR